MTSAILLAAAIVVLTMLARIEITALSDSAASLEAEIAELEDEKLSLQVEDEFCHSLSKIEAMAEDIGMISPSEIGALFLQGKTDDVIIVYSEIDQG